MIYLLVVMLLLNLGFSSYHALTLSYGKATYFMVVSTFILVALVGMTR
jgi:hypothetical protein